MSDFDKICKKVHKILPDAAVTEERGCIVLRGEADDWKSIVRAGEAAVNKKNISASSTI